MAFKVGQKVVCVHTFIGMASDGITYKNFKLPVENEIYTVSELNWPQLSLLEFTQLHTFYVKWFRPLDYDFVEEVIKQVTPKEVEA